jgi:hypothetical protein
MDQALVFGRRVLLGFAVLTVAFLACPTPATAPALAADAATPSAPNRYVSEVVDSIFPVGPAEFYALDLPTQTPNAHAIHLLGTVNIADRKGDIIVRIFRGPEYQNWLKKKGGDHSGAFYVSKKLRTISLDMDLPDGPIVLLLDNGYSVRTPKHVHTQIQIQYERTGSVQASTPGSSTDSSVPPPDDFIAPRANTEEDAPPPPPPPPADDTTGQ